MRAYRDVKAGSFMHPLGAELADDYLGRVAPGEETPLHYDGARHPSARGTGPGIGFETLSRLVGLRAHYSPRDARQSRH